MSLSLPFSPFSLFFSLPPFLPPSISLPYSLPLPSSLSFFPFSISLPLFPSLSLSLSPASLSSPSLPPSSPSLPLSLSPSPPQARGVYLLPGSACAGHGGGRHDHPSGPEGSAAAGLPLLSLPARVALHGQRGERSARPRGLPHGVCVCVCVCVRACVCV